MNDAQIWTVISVVAAALFGTIAALTGQVGRTLTAQIAGLRGEMIARFGKRPVC